VPRKTLSPPLNYRIAWLVQGTIAMAHSGFQTAHLCSAPLQPPLLSVDLIDLIAQN
jgi:hypothetical protein